MTVLPALSAKSVQCCVTSPPYWGLRSYGFKKDDPARLKMIGLEPTFDRHLWNIVRVFREVRRVLRDDATLWLNYGDAYSGSWGNYAPGGIKNQQRLQTEEGKRWARPAYSDTTVCQPMSSMRLSPKNLIGMAWRVAFALQADGWILRSDIIWHKRSPMPESVRDRPTKAHEYIFMFSKSPRYFYDQEAVREKSLTPGDRRHLREDCRRTDPLADNSSRKATGNPTGFDRNMRSVWTLSHEPFAGAHFATFPTELVARCLKAGTSAKGCCPTCGAPWKRITESQRRATRPGTGSKVGVPTDWASGSDHTTLGHAINRETNESVDRPMKPWAAAEVGNRDPKRHVTEFKTVGWRPRCECEGRLVKRKTWVHFGDRRSYKSVTDYFPEGPQSEPNSCAVLDPFAGSGTVGVVCRRMGLDFVGVELNAGYCGMARRRISRAMDEPQPEVAQSAGQMELIT